MLTGAVELGEEQHAAAHEAPVTGILGAEAGSADGAFPERGEHDGIDHGAGRGQQILKGDRDCDDGDHLNQPQKRKLLVV